MLFFSKINSFLSCAMVKKSRKFNILCDDLQQNFFSNSVQRLKDCGHKRKRKYSIFFFFGQRKSPFEYLFFFEGKNKYSRKKCRYRRSSNYKLCGPRIGECYRMTFSALCEKSQVFAFWGEYGHFAAINEIFTM
jgi:hypothetical protein